MVNSTFVSEDELKDIVNEQTMHLYDILLETRGNQFYAKDAPDIALTNGVAVYPLPADFYQLVGVRLYDGNTVTMLKTWEEQELGNLENAEKMGGSGSRLIRYNLSGANIILRPKPANDNLTLRVRYVPAFLRMGIDSDTFDGINGWELWVELSAAITMMQKEETDPSPLVVEREKVEQRIRKQVVRRDAGRPPRITDTRGDWAGSPFDYKDDWDL